MFIKAIFAMVLFTAADRLGVFSKLCPRYCEESDGDGDGASKHHHGKWMSVVFAAADALIVGAGLMALVSRRKKAAKAKAEAALAKKRAPAPQIKLDPIPPEAPGKGAPIFSGVRVVELATHIAAPSAGRVMGDLGAEVVHVESPDGDLWRYTLLAYEQYPKPRAFGTPFEITSMSKLSVQLDLKTKEGLEKFNKILSEADVFITNVRIPSLKAMSLDYDSVHAKFPKVVYARVTAWGANGSDSAKPGYDIGGFWTATGLSSSINDAPNFNTYPPGFGDLTTAQSLLGGIATALTDRLRTGNGQLVDTALLRVGAWVGSSIISNADPKQVLPEIPDYSKSKTAPHPLRHTYISADNVTFSIVAEGKGENAALAKLSNALNISGTLSSVGGKEEVMLVAALQDAFSGKTYSSIDAILSEIAIAHTATSSLPECIFTQDDRYVDVFEAPPKDIDDLSRVIKIPYDFSSSARHGPTKRAPFKGENTDDFLQRGWSSVASSLEASPSFVASSDEGKKGVMRGINIVELSSSSVGLRSCSAASAACALLADLDANVVKLCSESGDYWEVRDPCFYSHLNRGKSLLPITSGKRNGLALKGTLKEAHILITDLSSDEMSQDWIAVAELRKSFPSLVIVTVSPWGFGKPCGSAADGAFGAMYVAGPCLPAFCGNNGRAKTPSQHMWDQIASMFVYSATSIALFHQVRSGEGQIVNLNLARLGYWLQQVVIAWATKDPAKANMFGGTIQDLHWAAPICTFNCYKTKDGMWVQLLGLSIGRHLSKVVNALQINMSLYTKLALTVLSKVLFSKEKSKMVKLRPVFKTLTHAVQAGFEKYTYDEFKEIAIKHDIWYCPVRTPAQLLHYEQATVNGTFALNEATGKCVVNSPVQFSTMVPKKVCADVPSL